ncbi:MAG: DUF1570 domain-containing protein [Isosphaeraceae bacterium]
MNCPRCARTLSLATEGWEQAASPPGEGDSRPEGPRRPGRKSLIRVLNSATAAVFVCASLALFVATSALLTPRLTGRTLGPATTVEDLPPPLPVVRSRPTDVAETHQARRPVSPAPVAPEVPELATRAVLAQLFPALGQPPSPLLPRRDQATANGRPGGPLPGLTPRTRLPGSGGSDRAKVEPPPPPKPAAVAGDTPPPAPRADSRVATSTQPRRIRVRNPQGRPVIARVHGGTGRDTHILLPDGQLGIPDTLIETDEPFVPASPSEIEADLLSGPFAGFKALRTAHYVILYQSSPGFAEESGRVLESLYKGLLEAFRKFEVDTHEAEFPLVAIIFATEGDFRAHRKVDAAVQAYYEIYSNRIYFYESSERDEQAPEVAALRRPQTVAHEGTHQILQNIGIQPRLATWPPWLIEGLAEYCATPASTKKGPTWSGIGVVNAQHLATIRDLDDPLSGQVPGATRPEHIGRRPGMPLVEYLVTKTELSPTDYALAWAMTHYLAMKRVDAFVAYLRVMSRLTPLQARTPADQLATFREAFGDNLVKLDKDIGKYLSRVKVNDRLPYYAVMFEQRVPCNLVRRAAIVSQSPSMILQWLQTVTSPRGDEPSWKAVPHSTRTRAYVTAEQFMQGL